ncbi:hypothetical protein [Rhodococcus sp. P1Y]|uniref:hypothetical protein n=1 Tax=Rhodococcus sp. P1Y TaxID=1302308 RepID=UPI000EB40E39|nr:hypothetical protein [Rhodococcus sp. P1Y]AYJ47357.1 hypothetical protein D8W71_02210 [Rhodococcus sp. P1Y]
MKSISAHYARLLDEALQALDAQPGYGVVLEGSIAEGFGNSTSDVDFLLIEPGERTTPLIPTIIFRDGRRVEVRVRSVHQIALEINHVLSGISNDSSSLDGVTFDQLDRVQRLCRSVVYRRSVGTDHLKSLVPPAAIDNASKTWFAQLVNQSVRCGLAMEAIEEWQEAVQWYRTAVEQGAKAWLCSQGESYLSVKWTSLQFARLPSAHDRFERFRDLLITPRGTNEDMRSYAIRAKILLSDFGFDLSDLEPRSVFFTRKPDTTTWQIGDRVHIVRNREEVYVLSSAARTVWRSIDFNRCAADQLADLRSVVARPGQCFSEFHRLGFLGLRWSNGEEVNGRSQSSSAPSTSLPVISIRGAEVGDATEDVRLVPLAPAQFAGAGIALVWANAEIENSREDAIGALDAEQWGTFQSATRRMVRKAAMVALTANGLVPRSSNSNGLGGSSWQRREADEEACARMTRIPGLPGQLVQTALALEAGSPIAGREDAESALKDVDQFVHSVRDVTGGSLFPSSFVSPAEWRETLELSYDWVRMAAFLDSAFPLDEARDLVAVSHG